MAWNVYCEDVEEFRNTMLSLPMGEDLYHPDDTDFRSSAAVAMALDASGAPEYVEYLEEIVKLRPKLLTAYRKGYGQPIFRQIFENGSEKSWDFYLKRSGCLERKSFLTKLLPDAREYHEKALDGLSEIKSITFEKEKMPYPDENGDYFDLCDQFVQEDPRELICHFNTIVRQRRMLKKLEEVDKAAFV